METTHSCSQAVDFLLAEIVPPTGAAILLLRHPVGSVFFPMALVLGRNCPGFPDKILNRYFLYSTYIRNESDEISTLDQSTSAKDLVLHGKLAVALFDRGPIQMQTYFCDEGHEVAVCTLNPLDPDAPAPSIPSPNIRGALAACIDTWKLLAKTSVQIDCHEPADVADIITSLASDENISPPYFSILFATTEYRTGSKGTMASGHWRANSLTHNCHLLAYHEKHVSDYIQAMVEIQSPTPYSSEPPEETNKLAAAVANVCTDLIHPFGILSGSNTRVFARLNIPIEDGPISSTRIAKLDRESRTTDDPWSLISAALQYLDRDHPDSTLVTAWLGDVDDEGVFQYAVPIGFVPGGRSDVLVKVALQPELSFYLDERFDRRKRLCTKFILLDPENQTGISPSLPGEINQLVDEILARGSSAIHGLEHTFPGPYSLNFQRCQMDKPLVISSLGDSTATFEVCPIDDIHLYEFLHELCLADEMGIKLVPRELIESKWGPNGQSSATIVESMKERLRRRRGSPPVDDKFLFTNRKGKGWVWAGLKRSVYQGLSTDAYAHLMGDMDTFESKRRR